MSKTTTAISGNGFYACLTAADIEREPKDRSGISGTPIGRLHDIGREIRARVDKLNHLGGKAVDMVDSIDHLLAEAEKCCDAEGFVAFKKTYCPELGQSRTYELLAIQDGRKTLDQIRAATRQRVAKHREAKRVTEKDSVTSNAPATTIKLNGQSVKADDLGPAAREKIIEALKETPQESAEARKAQHAAAEEQASTIPMPGPLSEPTPTIETIVHDAKAISENTYEEIMRLIDDRLSSLHTTEKIRLLAYIINHPALAKLKVPRREKATA